MSKKNSNSLMLISGLIAGAATVAFLKSEKGKKMIDLALSKSEELLEVSQNLIGEGKTVLGDVVESGKEKMESTFHDVKEASGNKLSEFNKGIEKAKKQIAKS